MAKDVAGQFAARFDARDKGDVGLGHAETHLVGCRHDGGFTDGRVLDEHALEFERTDPVVTRFEDVVGATDVGDVAVLVAAGDVAGVVATTGEGPLVQLVIRTGPRVVAGHHADRTFGRARHADLTVVTDHIGDRVDQLDSVPGNGATHRPGLHALSRRVADLNGGLGLTEAVTDRQSPGAIDRLDHFGIERLAGADQFAQRQ